MEIHDATLRDGEQTPGVVFSAEDKVRIAEKLVEAGVTRIEAGMPAVSAEDRRAITEIAHRFPQAQVYAFARAKTEDIDMARDAGVKGVVIEIPIGYPKLKYQAAAEPDSVIIPVLNLFGIGDLLAGKLGEGFHVMDGCIYVTSFVSAPGEVTQQASLLKLVFGPREGQGDPPHLERILADLESAKVPTVYTKEIRRETFKKFAFISPFAAACALYDADAAQFQKEGEARETFRALASEMKALGDRLGLSPGDSFVEKSMKTVDHFQPDVTASMERDLRAGKPAEIDNLVCEVIRLCGRLGLEAPAYRRAAEKLCPKTN